MKKKIIAVFTGNRAEYGLQMPILREIDNHPELDYRLIVSGAHLDKNFGKTLSEISSDGFNVHYEVKINIENNQVNSTSLAIGSAIIEISNALIKFNPDILMVYADRYEGFAAIIAASQMNIPVAHIEGGDITEGGSLDDSVRHAMTKLSHLHFTTNIEATNRILAMGEERWRVHTVGLPSIDLISQSCYASKCELVDYLKITLEKPIIIFTQHPVTTEFQRTYEQIRPSLLALEHLALDGYQIIITYPNNDIGSNIIIENLKHYETANITNIQVHKSLGRHIYHGLLALAKDSSIRIVCVGNSSSGIKETPFFGCPTVNIGSRQDGRLRSSNVVDALYSTESILRAIKHCLHDENFRMNCRSSENPYWNKNASKKIVNIISNIDIDAVLIRKRMMLEGKERDGWFK